VCRSSECCAHAVPILSVLCRSVSISVSIFRVLCLLNADLSYLRSASQRCRSVCVDVCRRVSVFRVLCLLNADLCLSSECIPTTPICVYRRVSTCVDVCLSSECCAYSMPICVYLQSAVPTQCRSASISVSIFRVLCPCLCVSSECFAHVCVYLQSTVPISVSIFRVLCLLNAGLSSECCAHLSVYLQSPSLCLSSEYCAYSMPVYLQSAVPISGSIFRVLCILNAGLSSEYCAYSMPICIYLRSASQRCRSVASFCGIYLRSVSQRCRSVALRLQSAMPTQRVSTCVDVCRRVSTCVDVTLSVCLSTCADPQSAGSMLCQSSACCADLCLSLCLSSQCGVYSMPICVYLRSAVPTQCPKP